MRITTLNVNGIRSAERRGMRKWLAQNRPDVFCMQEVRATESDVPADLWNPDGYRASWFPAQKKGYAGTAVWSAKKRVSFTTGTGHERGDAEGRVVGVHLPEVDVWSVYLPSGSSGDDRQAWKMEYLAHIFPWLDRLLAKGKPALVCGDLNIAHTRLDIKNATANAKNSGFLPEERAWLDGLVARGWQDLFRVANPTLEAYSWWSQRGNARANDVGWRIDHIWATPGVRVTKATIDRSLYLSDHAPVTVEIEL